MDHTLTRQMGLLFLGRMAAFACAFALPLILVRMFSVEDFGLYKQLFLIHVSVMSILGFGFSASLYYFVPRHGAQERAAYVVQTLYLLTGLGVVGVCGLILFKSRIAQTFNNPNIEGYLPYVAAFTLLSLMASMLESLMIILKQTKLAALTNVGSELLRATLSVGVALATHSILALVMVAFVWAGSRLLALLLYLRSLGISWWVLPDRQRLAEQFRYTVPYGFAIITWTLATNLHQYVVSYLYDPAMFAVYAVGCLQLPILSMVFETISDVTLVRLTELGQQGGRMESVRLIGQSVVKLALVLFPAYVWLTISARDVLVLLYTDRFLSSVDIFTVFLVTLPLAALELDYVARAFADTRFILQINIMRLIVTAALLAMLVPSLGLLGAVGAFVLAIALSKLLTLYKLSTLYEVPVRRILPWIDLGKVLAIAWMTGLAALAVPAIVGSSVPALVGSSVPGTIGPASLPVRLIASASVFLPVYVTLIWLSGVLHAEEKQWMAGQARRLKGAVTAWFTIRRPAAAEDR